MRNQGSLMSYGQTVYVKTRNSVLAFEADDMIGTHSADFIIGTGKYPVKDAGYMACIRFGNSKKP
jgi:hypothetical protein